MLSSLLIWTSPELQSQHSAGTYPSLPGIRLDSFHIHHSTFSAVVNVSHNWIGPQNIPTKERLSVTRYCLVPSGWVHLNSKYFSPDSSETTLRAKKATHGKHCGALLLTSTSSSVGLKTNNNNKLTAALVKVLLVNKMIQ